MLNIHLIKQFMQIWYMQYNKLYLRNLLFPTTQEIALSFLLSCLESKIYLFSHV